MIRRSERGAVVVLAAVLMVVLLGAGALALDLGAARVDHRHAQGSADAAALAAAAELDDFAAARAAAIDYATRNVTGDDVEVDVMTPFVPDDASPDGAYVRVRVCSPSRQFFAGVIGQDAPRTCAVAVAERRQVGSPLGTGIIVLNPPARCPGLLIRGNADVSVTTEGAVFVDDTCDQALSGSGAAFRLTAGLISIVGDYDVNGQCLSACFPAALPATGQSPIGDPLADLDEPPRPSSLRSCSTSGNGPNRVTTCSPGRYSGNENFSGGPGRVVLRPGIHWFDGNVDFGNKHVEIAGPSHPDTGNGVMLFLASGVLDLSGNGTALLTPPDSGPYAGVSVFQGRSNTSVSKITGTTGTTVGTVYAPVGKLEVGGNSNWDIDGMLVAAELELFGNMNLGLTPPTNVSPALDEEVIGLHR